MTKEEINALQEENSALKEEIKNLKSEITAHTLTNEKLTETNMQKDELINTLDAKLSESMKGAPVKDLGTVKVDKKEYRITVPAVNVEGTVYTAEDIKSKKDVAKALVEMESGVLVAID